MKTFILLLTLFFSHLLADEKPIISDISFYDTNDSHILIDTIIYHDKSFISFDKNHTIDTNQTAHWLRITLENTLISGDYVIAYAGGEFDISSFRPEQNLQKFHIYNGKNISFHYQRKRDSQVYYLRLSHFENTLPSYINATSKTKMYQSIEDFTFYLLISGIVLGLIMMAAIYNGALYYYNKEKAFLYYALMQVFMVGVLFFHTGVPYILSKFFLTHPSIYEYLSLITAFFAVLFARTFLNTKEYLPAHDKVLLFFLAFIMIDMLYYPKAMLSSWSLYSITTAYFLVVGFLRLRQGYKPAWFFFIGWIAMVCGIIMIEYFEEYAYFDTMLLGSSIEAIMLALALAYKIQQISKKREAQKELLIHQSRLASMGEMIGNIAHQWRQPLTHLSYIMMNVEEITDKKERKIKIAEATKQLEFMSQTIDDFKDFYAPDKEMENFSLSKESQHVMDLMHFEDIKVTLEIYHDMEILNYKNQYKQVLLNLLSNAKEALIQRHIKEPRITIMIKQSTITVEDNAGGIQEAHIHKIFEPYFSTKEKSSGVGLYMSKMIVEKNMGGVLAVKNSKKGAIFSLKLPT